MVEIPNPKRGEDTAALFLSIEPEALEALVDNLAKAFVWDESAEGHVFWSIVKVRLYDMLRLYRAGQANKAPEPPKPPARPSSLAAPCDIRDWLDAGANGIDVEHHDAHERNAPEWSVYLLVPFGGRREWIADYEIGTNSDQYTAEEAETLAYDYAERLLEAFPCLRARGINPKK